MRWVATGYASLGMFGIVFEGLPLLPDPPLTRPLTASAAVSLTVLAIGALLSGDIKPSSSRSVVLRRVGMVLAVWSALFGIAIMVVFFVNRTDLWGMPEDVPAFSVGVILLVLGIAVPLSVSRSESMVVVSQIGAFLVFSLTAVIFFGYLYGDPSVGRLFLRPEISFQASITSVLIAIGVVLMRPASGMLSMASSPGAGGRLLRRMGPVVVFTPAVLLFVAETVPSTERIDVLAFISVGLGLLLLIMLTVFVRALDQTAIEAATAAAQAERARVGLQQEAPVITVMAETLHTVEVADSEPWEVATRFRPGRGSVAGDASAVRMLPDGSVGAVLVDLTGHGALPAVWAIRLRDLLVHSLVSGNSPAEAVASVAWSAPGDALASAMVLTVSENGDVLLCSAGHPPVIVVDAQDSTMWLPTGPLLYLDPQARYEEDHFTISPGDTLVAFSDGVADVQVLRNSQTEPELLAGMLVTEGGTAARTAELALGFAPSEPTDDQTVVVIRRTS